MTFSTCKPEINYFFDFFTPAPPDFTNIWSMKLCSARTATPGDPRESGAISPNISSGTEQCKRFSDLFTLFQLKKHTTHPGNHASIPLPPRPPEPRTTAPDRNNTGNYPQRHLICCGPQLQAFSVPVQRPAQKRFLPRPTGDAGGSGSLPYPPPPAMENRQKLCRKHGNPETGAINYMIY